MTAPIACPTCGMTSWRRAESGLYSETHYLHTDTAELHDFDNREDVCMDNGEWVCMGEQHPAPDEIVEQLEELT